MASVSHSKRKLEEGQSLPPSSHFCSRLERLLLAGKDKNWLAQIIFGLHSGTPGLRSLRRMFCL